MDEIIQDELKFYSRFCKPLILNLPTWKDRVLASQWVKKIRDETTGTESLRIIYLKLLLFSLQRRRLVGIFGDDPANYDELEPIPEGFDLNDIAKNLLEVEFAERQDRIRQQLRGQIGVCPPYMTDCSSDFREYIAVQNVPGFGVHSYFAISKEPVNRWNRSEKGIFPKLARSAVDTTNPRPGEPDDNCMCVDDATKVDPSCLCKKNAQPKPARKLTKKFGRTPPIPPMGVFYPPSSSDRAPPTWGSSLSQVREKLKSIESDEEVLPPEELELTDVLGGFVQFVEEFQKGTIDKVSKMKTACKVIPGKDTGKTGVKSEEHNASGDEDENKESEEDLNVSRHEADISADSHLISYYRDLLSQSSVNRSIAMASSNMMSSSPARTGIPMSTPTSSPTPKRVPSSERLYGEHLVAMSGPAPVTSCSDGDDEDEAVSSTDDDFTVWNKRLRAVQKECERHLTQLDVSQQVDKTFVLSKKGVPKQNQGCGPGDCGSPCE